jgi:hypothetical protein
MERKSFRTSSKRDKLTHAVDALTATLSTKPVWAQVAHWRNPDGHLVVTLALLYRQCPVEHQPCSPTLVSSALAC